jgi:hypothetical protein
MIRAFLVAIAVLVTGCSNSGSGPNTALLDALSAPSSSTQVTENFTGTVPIGGSDKHTFTVTTSNQAIAVTLTAAGPPATIAMGIGVGQMSGDTCSLFSNATVVLPASTTPQLAGTISAGTYCVAVFDASSQTASVDYALTVVHF